MGIHELPAMALEWIMTRNRDESTSLSMYLQSYRHFASSGIPFELLSLKSGREWVKECRITVGIHVRRTDQLTDAHSVKGLRVGYFETVLEMLRKTTDTAITAVVCTDNTAWVRV